MNNTKIYLKHFYSKQFSFPRSGGRVDSDFRQKLLKCMLVKSQFNSIDKQQDHHFKVYLCFKQRQSIFLNVDLDEVFSAIRGPLKF